MTRFRRPFAKLALLGTALFTLTGCQLLNPTKDSGVTALESSNGSTLLFMLTLADVTDVEKLATDLAATSAQYGVADRSLPVCFYRATGLTQEERAAFGSNISSFQNIPRPLLTTKVQALRPEALDYVQAGLLAHALVAEENLSPEAAKALFSPEIVQAAAVGVDDAKLTRIAEGLASKPAEEPLVDYSDVSCAMVDVLAVLDGKPPSELASSEGGVTLRTSQTAGDTSNAPNLDLIRFTPLQRKAINTVIPIFLMFTNFVQTRVPLYFGGGGVRLVRTSQILKETSEKLNLMIATDARTIKAMRMPPRPPAP